MLDRRNLLKLSAAMIAMPAIARAQAWPSKPIKVVVPFAAGGSTDVLARMLSDELKRSLGASFIVENRPGMAGSLGADYTAKQPADGYTILYATPGAQMTNQFLYPSLPYDPVKDLRPIIHLTESPNVLVVNPTVPVKSTAEFIAYAKANPGKMNYSSTGPGSASHLAMELLKSMAGIDIVHVPYKGSGPAVIDLVSGVIQCSTDAIGAVMPHVQQGSLRALGISTPKRMAEFPDVPAIAETLSGYEASSLIYVCCAAGVPDEIVARLNAVFNEALASPVIRARAVELGLVPTGGTPDALQQIIETDRSKWKRIIEMTGAKAI
jgi:tripartite-type tricarboxylate transporter receptor subunit TctC